MYRIGNELLGSSYGSGGGDYLDGADFIQPGDLLAVADCNPVARFIIRSGSTQNNSTTTDTEHNLYAVHGACGVTGWAYSEVGTGLPQGATICSTLVMKDLNATGKDWYGTASQKQFSVVLCNHFTLGQFLRGVHNRLHILGNAHTSPSVRSDLMGTLDPQQQSDGTFRVATVRSTLRSTPRSDVVLSGSVTSCYGAIGRPYTVGYTTDCETGHSLTLPPGDLKNVCVAESVCGQTGMNTQFDTFRHRRGFTNKNHALTVILTTSPSTERHIATEEISPHLAWTIVMQDNGDLIAEDKAYLPAIAAVVAKREQPRYASGTGTSSYGDSKPIFVEQLPTVDHVNAWGFHQRLNVSLGGDYLLGYRIVRGTMPAVSPLGACYLYSNGTITCRYGSFTSGECPKPGAVLEEESNLTEPTAPGRFVSTAGWEFAGGGNTGVPALPSCKEWNVGVRNIPREPLTNGRWNDLWCCRDVMALMWITGFGKHENIDTGSGMRWLSVWEVEVAITVSVRGDAKATKHYTGRTYAYEWGYIDVGEWGFDIDAGAFLSCECGLNIYEVFISGVWNEETGKVEGAVHEVGVYRGTEKEDFEWGICCGDNHLLVGKGKHGWEPDIKINENVLGLSKCWLDDGTECTVAEVRRELLWSNVPEDMLDLLVMLTEQVKQGHITYEQLLAAVDQLENAGEIWGEAYIHSWRFFDPENKERVFLNNEWAPFRYVKDPKFAVYANTRKHVDEGSESFVEDDTLYDVKCWANQYGEIQETSNLLNYGEGNNSRDAAFLTYGAKGAHPERVIRRVEDPLTGEVTIDTVALEVKDNHKFYSGHRVSGPLRRLKHPAEAYLQKARERNHRRTGLYVKMDGVTRTNNPDFDSDGNLREGIELDFDHIPEGSSPDASLRLYVDDKESWYRYDRLPSASGLDEEPTGVEWNHPDAEFHRTTVWSGNGQLYVEHVPVEEIGVRSQESGEGSLPFASSPNSSLLSPNSSEGGGCGTCGKNISW